MSSVVIRPEDGQPDSLKALLAAVRKHAGDERVTVGSGGVVVSRAVAKKFLNARTTPNADTTGATVDNTRAPLVTHHADGTTTPTEDGDLTIGGRTPDGDLPGGHAGTPAVQPQTTAPNSRADAAGQAADGGPSPSGVPGGVPDGEPTPAPKPAPPHNTATPAKKTTAAAQQRASRSTRSNP